MSEDNTKDSPNLAAEHSSCGTKLLKRSPKDSIDADTSEGNIVTEKNKFDIGEEARWLSHQQHKPSSLTVVAEKAELKSTHPSPQAENATGNNELPNPRESHGSEVSSIIGSMSRGVYFDMGVNDDTATSSRIENNTTGYLEADWKRRSGARVTRCRSGYTTTDQDRLHYQKMLNVMIQSFHRKLAVHVANKQEMQLQLDKAKSELKSERHEWEHGLNDLRSECDKLRDELVQVQEEKVEKEKQIIRQIDELSCGHCKPQAKRKENTQGEQVREAPPIKEIEFFEAPLTDSQEDTDKQGCNPNISPLDSPKEGESIYPGKTRLIRQRFGAPAKDLFAFAQKRGQAADRGNNSIRWSPSIKKSSSFGDCVRPVQLVSADEGAQKPRDKKDSKRRSERAFAA